MSICKKYFYISKVPFCCTRGRDEQDGMTMKSIVNEALARHEEEKKTQEVMDTNEVQPPSESFGDDKELEEVVKSLNVSIKILGAGGGGSNTINRLTTAGIIGAQVCALNTDAKHLLAIHSPKKMLIGKEGDERIGRRCPTRGW
jgi:cell division protein FtsZ